MSWFVLSLLITYIRYETILKFISCWYYLLGNDFEKKYEMSVINTLLHPHIFGTINWHKYYWIWSGHRDWKSGFIRVTPVFIGIFWWRLAIWIRCIRLCQRSFLSAWLENISWKWMIYDYKVNIFSSVTQTQMFDICWYHWRINLCPYNPYSSK